MGPEIKELERKLAEFALEAEVVEEDVAGQRGIAEFARDDEFAAGGEVGGVGGPQGVVPAQFLDRAAVATLPAVDGDDPVERPVRVSHASQAKLHGHDLNLHGDDWPRWRGRSAATPLGSIAHRPTLAGEVTRHGLRIGGRGCD